MQNPLESKSDPMMLSSRLSYWEYDYLLRDIDYLIVGAGIVGISVAIEILEDTPGCNVLIIDKKSVPVGASTRNAGFACFGSVSEILDDVTSFGEDAAADLISMRYEGLGILRSRMSAETMRFRSEPGIEIFEDGEADRLLSQIPFVNRLVKDATGIVDCFVERSGRYGVEIANKHEGSLHPQRMMAALEVKARSLGARMMTGIHAVRLDHVGHILETTYGHIAYRKLILCTNGFTGDLVPEVDLQPARNQVLITEPMEGFTLNGCYHMNKGFVYFREVDNRLLLGGGRHIDMEKETTSELEINAYILSYLSELAEQKILQGHKLKVAHTWSGILGVGSDKMPIVRFVHDDVVAAIRMGGMGVAIGSKIGRMVRTLLR